MFYYDFMTGEIFLYYESKFLCIGSNILLYTISLITNFDSVMEAFVVWVNIFQKISVEVNLKYKERSLYFINLRTL